MWVFDGEQWTEEGGSDKSRTTDTRPRYEEGMPELQVIEQVIEHIPSTPATRNEYIPPFPLP